MYLQFKATLVSSSMDTETSITISKLVNVTMTLVSLTIMYRICFKLTALIHADLALRIELFNCT